jgi:hypothetical protein
MHTKFLSVLINVREEIRALHDYCLSKRDKKKTLYFHPHALSNVACSYSSKIFNVNLAQNLEIFDLGSVC